MNFAESYKAITRAHSFLPMFVLSFALAQPAMGQSSGEGMTALPGKGAEKKYSYWILAPDDLKKCVEQGSAMTSAKNEIPVLDKKIAQQEAELSALKTKIQQMIKASAATSEYNKAVEEYNTKNAAYAADLKKYQELVDKHNESLAEYKNNCAGHQFYEEDYKNLFGAGK